MTDLLWRLSLSLLLSSCVNKATIPEFSLGATRPANQDGIKVNVKTGEYIIIPKEEWRLRLRKSIILEKEDWVIIKKALYTPCITYDCTDELDLISDVFEKIDQSIIKVL